VSWRQRAAITAFDIAALDSVQRASPFGKPPKAIVSPDGAVYFHWEFHRDPVYACSTMETRDRISSTCRRRPSRRKPKEPPHLHFLAAIRAEQPGPAGGFSRQGLVARAAAANPQRRGAQRDR